MQENIAFLLGQVSVYQAQKQRLEFENAELRHRLLLEEEKALVQNGNKLPFILKVYNKKLLYLYWASTISLNFWLSWFFNMVSEPTRDKRSRVRISTTPHLKWNI